MRGVSLLLWVMVSVFVFSGCLSSDHPFVPFETYQPRSIDDGWVVSTPGEEGVDPIALTEFYERVHSNQDLWQLRSLLVIKNGRLVAESYLKDENDLFERRPIWSCTKQVLAVLVGIGLEEGLINSLSDPISDYLPEMVQLYPEKAGITIEDLLTMQSGIDFDEDADASQLIQRRPDNTIQYILDLPMAFTPGDRFSYNSGNSHLIASALQNAAGRPTDEWADDILFSKIGFSNYTWLRYDEYSFGGWGIATTPRELAKVAHLVLNQGMLDNEQVVTSAWINQMLEPHITNTGNPDVAFGYHWWMKSNLTAYYMAGSGGQYAIIYPEKELIVVAMSEHDTDGELELEPAEFFELADHVASISN